MNKMKTICIDCLIWYHVSFLDIIKRIKCPKCNNADIIIIVDYWFIIYLVLSFFSFLILFLFFIYWIFNF